jgi:hypothetical protein
VVSTWGFDGPDPFVAAGSTGVEVTLAPDGDATLLTLLHHGLEDGARDPHAKGWSHYLARFAPVAARRLPEPDPWIVNE